MKCWLVRQPPWSQGHCGPFSSRDDADLAKRIATKSWQEANVVDDKDFEGYAEIMRQL